MSKKQLEFLNNPKKGRQYNKHDLQKLADKLLRVFAWDSTPQGDYYWSAVHDNLEKLIEGVNNEQETSSKN